MERNILKFANTTLQPTSVTSNTMETGAALLNSVSRQTSQMADEAVASWQKARVEEATTAGQTAGGLPQVDYKPNDGTLTASAFNQAAARTHMSVMTTTMQAKLNEFQDKFSDNPGEYLKQSTQYIKGMVDEMKLNPESAKYANQFEMQARLQQESQGYTVARKYQAKVIEDAKAANEDFMFNVKNDTYRNSSGIFSKDPQEQAYTLNQFANAKKMFSASLHQVLPNGKAVYSEKEIRSMEREFHTGYYTKAMKDYISSDSATTSELIDVMNNSAKIKLPIEGGKMADIDILSEMGTEAYDKVKTFTMTKLRERAALAKAEQAAAKAAMAEQRKMNAFHLATDIAQGKAIPLDTIDSMLERGQIDYAGAVAARNMALNPANRDDAQAVTVINTAIANGVDATTDIASAASVLSPQTIINLSKANAQMQAKGRNTLYKEHLKMIKAEFGEKSMFGEFTDTNMAAVYNDLQMDYMDMVQEGTEPDLAFEKIRDVAEGIKKADEQGKFERFKDLMVKTDGVVDKAATYQRIKEQFDSGAMDESLAFYYMDKLDNTGE